MELMTGPMWNYITAIERLRNAMLLTAAQGITGSNNDELDAEVAERMFASTLRWAWTAAAQTELKYQDNENCSLVALRHSELRQLMSDNVGKEGVPFVTSEGVAW
jgi:hypothetical protein